MTRNGISLLFSALLALMAGTVTAQTPKPASAEDAVLAYEAAQISRSAVRDQLDLCAEDADKVAQVFAKLRPAADAERSEWTDWGDLYKRTGAELMSCLRAYTKQRILHNRDVALLRDRLPLLKEPKRLTISPKQVGQINAYAAGLDKELAGYAQRAQAMATAAEQTSGGVAVALRDAGVTKIEVPKGFAAAL